MGLDEATKFWEKFETLPKDAQADYMNERFGELLADISRDWEDYESEMAELDKYIKTESEDNRVFVDDKDKEKFLELCEELFAIAEDFNREDYVNESAIIKDTFSEIVSKLDVKTQQELQEQMSERGL